LPRHFAIADGSAAIFDMPFRHAAAIIDITFIDDMPTLLLR
jgi:hypothetical protein